MFVCVCGYYREGILHGLEDLSPSDLFEQLYVCVVSHVFH